MGGLGSGRYYHWNAKNLTSEFRSIDVRRWARDGLLTPGQRFSWRWSIEREKVASIDVETGREQIRLIYRSREHGDDWESHDYTVRLLSQECHFGGYREWFACPASGCGRRVAKLYGGRIFACRHCYGLAYASQSETDYQRYQRRASAIKERLGWDTSPSAYWGNRPKGMHRKTFGRLIEELDYWESESNSAFALSFLAKFESLTES